MASFSSPTFPSPSTRTDPSPYKLLNFTSPKLKRSVNYNYNSHSRVSDPSSTLRRCKGSSGNGDGSSESPSTPRRWDTAIQEALKSAIKRFDDFVNAKSINVAERENELKNDEDDEEWDWERWKQHFKEVDEQERVVSILKSQLAQAVNMENYEDAARLKVAIAAAAANDTVGRVMSHLNKALEEERYREAALIRDDACAGLVGWWAGISENTGDPYGCIVQISAEHGRYVARSYSPRQLATAADGAPLFEIFLAMNKEGEYMQQAVYLKRSRAPVDLPIISPKSSVAMGSLDPLGPTENKTDLFEKDSEDTEDTEDSDNNSGFENVLRDMIPGVEVKVLKVTTPGKVDRDFISKVVEQIIEDEDEEDEEKDFELESVDSENESKGETDEEKNEIELDATSEISSAEEQSEIAVKLVVGGLVQKSSIGKQHKELLRVPATLEKKGLTSFTFTVEEEDSKDISDSNGHSSPNKKAKLLNPRSVDHLMLDLAKSIGRGRIPMKVLKDVGEMINLTLSQARNRQPLSGSTTFNRIDIPASRDPLNGLYIGAHGLYTSEVIQLRRRYGQWKGDGNSKEPSDIEFYEYVEAVKLTGDPYVPAGQIAFRAKIGKRYQLPHKGIIPEEFGVIARYRGQGRLAEPGFRNPRWVDGELVILDGKYIRGGPVVGFVYWAPEYHFLVFFNRLRLQE